MAYRVTLPAITAGHRAIEPAMAPRPSVMRLRVHSQAAPTCPPSEVLVELGYQAKSLMKMPARLRGASRRATAAADTLLSQPAVTGHGWLWRVCPGRTTEYS
jgi:hypothetical protein